MKDEYCTITIHYKLNQSTRNDEWKLVSKPYDESVIGTKWIFKNKLNDFGSIVRNIARLVEKYYNQIKVINFEEMFTQIARLEVITVLLTFIRFTDFQSYQMDVKSAFLNRLIKESVYVKQSPGWEHDISTIILLNLKK